MNLRDLERWCEEENYPPIEPLSTERGILRHYRLEFNYYSHTRGGGALNIMSHAGGKVYGVVFELIPDDFDKIKEKEGHAYRETGVNVEVGNRFRGPRVFEVCKEGRSGPHRPTDDYLQIVLDGAKYFGLPKECADEITQAVERVEMAERWGRGGKHRNLSNLRAGFFRG